MNLAFFLIPKSHVSYLTEGSSFRQGLEKLRCHGYATLPVIGRDGTYRGCIHEGDFLWNMMSIGSIDPRDLEEARIDEIISDRMPPLTVSTPLPKLWERVLEQSIVPVVDDRNVFVGIISRRQVMAYLMDRKGGVEEAGS